MDVQLKRGLLEACVLAAVCRSESYGYKIIKDVSPCIDISESTLYPILKRLETGECVSARSAEHNGRLRRYYSITPRGRERIGEFLNEWKTMTDVFNYIKGEYESE